MQPEEPPFYAEEPLAWDEWAEWQQLYQRLSSSNRRFMLRQMRQRLKRRALVDRLPPAPLALRLPLLHAGLTFTCLSFLPHHPMAMPTAVGLALTAVLYLETLCRWRLA